MTEPNELRENQDRDAEQPSLEECEREINEYVERMIAAGDTEGIPRELLPLPENHRQLRMLREYDSFEMSDPTHDPNRDSS